MFRRKGGRQGSIRSARSVDSGSNHSRQDRIGGPKGIKSITFRSRSLPTPNNDVKGALKIVDNDTSLHSRYGEQVAEEKKRKVVFHELQIREYERTVGDNPSCSSGPPVGISWKYAEAATISVDAYETSRPERRTNFQMILPRDVRQSMLRKEWGVPQSQIAAAVRANVKAKHQRRSTVQSFSGVRQNFANDSPPSIGKAGKKVFRALLRRKSTDEQVADLLRQVDEVQASNHSQSSNASLVEEYDVSVVSVTGEEMEIEERVCDPVVAEQHNVVVETAVSDKVSPASNKSSRSRRSSITLGKKSTQKVVSTSGAGDQGITKATSETSYLEDRKAEPDGFGSDFGPVEYFT